MLKQDKLLENKRIVDFVLDSSLKTRGKKYSSNGLSQCVRFLS